MTKAPNGGNSVDIRLRHLLEMVTWNVMAKLNLAQLRLNLMKIKASMKTLIILAEG